MEKKTLSAQDELLTWAREEARGAGLPPPAFLGLAVRHFLSLSDWRVRLVQWEGLPDAKKGRRKPGKTSVADVQLSVGEWEAIEDYVESRKITKAAFLNEAIDAYRAYLVDYRQRYGMRHESAV